MNVNFLCWLKKKKIMYNLLVHHSFSQNSLELSCKVIEIDSALCLRIDLSSIPALEDMKSISRINVSSDAPAKFFCTRTTFAYTTFSDDTPWQRAALKCRRDKSRRMFEAHRALRSGSSGTARSRFSLRPAAVTIRTLVYVWVYPHAHTCTHRPTDRPAYQK